MVQKYIINPKKDDAKYNKKKKSSMSSGAFTAITLLVLLIAFTAGVAYGIFNLDSDPVADTGVVATVQEELGLIGAFGATYNIKADLGIVIDVCHGDMPDTPSDETFPLGKGVAIAVGPILNSKHTKAVIKLAKSEKITYQIDPEAGDTGTEAAVHAVAREGIPVVLLSIPSKYMHTTVEMVSVDDIIATGRLAARYIAGRVRD